MADVNVPMAPRTVSLMAGAVAAVVLATMVAFWDCTPSSSLACVPVERQAAAVTVFTLTLAPVVYFAKRLHSDKTRGRRASIGLYAELGDAYHGLEPNNHSDLRAVDVQGKTVCFTSRMFNHDIYDSLVHSGEIIFVDVEFQQDIQDVFQDIKEHNMVLLKIREMEESELTFHLHGGSTERLRRRSKIFLPTSLSLCQCLKNGIRCRQAQRRSAGQTNRDGYVGGIIFEAGHMPACDRRATYLWLRTPGDGTLPPPDGVHVVVA